jgi:hypothetical protein
MYIHNLNRLVKMRASHANWDSDQHLLVFLYGGVLDASQSVKLTEKQHQEQLGSLLAISLALRTLTSLWS